MAIARRVSCTALAGMLLAWPLVPRAAQDAPAQVFRGGVDLVRVDVYPRRGSQLAEGLHADDFEVLEDGKPQKIATFEFIPAPSGDAEDRRDPRDADEAARWIADPGNRVFVVYFDLYHMSRAAANAVRGPAMAFLSHTIGPTDIVAVMTPETAVSELVFARTLNTLSAEIAHYWAWGLADPPLTLRTPAEEEIAACASGPNGYDALIRRHRDIVVLTSLESLITRLGAMREERTSVILLSEGWTNGGGAALPGGSGRGFGGGRFEVSAAQFGGAPVDARPMPEASCGMVVGRLQGYDSWDHFKDILRSARANNVAFYPIDVGGLRTYAFGATGGAGPSRGGVDTLKELAENTGGFATTDSNDLSGALARVSSSLTGYYLLGYYSTNARADGRYHAIDVRMRPPGLTVSARRGYFAPTPEARRAPADGPTPAPIAPAVAEAIGRLSRLTDARLVATGVVSSSGIDIVVEIARHALEQGGWDDGAAVRVQVTGPSGPQTMAGRIEVGKRSTVLHMPRAGTDPGPWQATVTVVGASADLDEHVEIDAPSGPLLGSPRLLRADARPRAVFEPAAGAEFARGDRVRVEWPLIGAVDRQAIRVLDRRGQVLTLGAAMGDVVGAGADVAAAEVNLAALAEGDYLFEIVAQHGSDMERRLLPFRIGR